MSDDFILLDAMMPSCTLAPRFDCVCKLASMRLVCCDCLCFRCVAHSYFPDPSLWRRQVMVPISLYVSIEFVKIAQIFFLQNDIDMYDPESNKSVRLNWWW